jgi:serine/threonine-protein kinase
MPKCPKCSAKTADGSRFCPSCAAPLDESSSLTRTSADNTPTELSDPGSPSSAERCRFVPGLVLNKRYRIVGLLGRGGMGEVYRADDLKLGEPVALKFLPEGLERDRRRLDQFLNEVRTARQVTHSNVCRMFDVGEVNGQH